ncbi:hypothetical protein GCM10017744_103360 [Streptomyces antimycoticus]|uniref:Uncharacterized protein n=1 Tax=Streptomyces antimycoticus TaxID=68175 RepID=A0A4D4KS10_9ACTN|nr:hypothetical protein [Streptomyces antimycoticus]GDY49370.1 hypothetical protein SANT12839_102520 [Streptomyces antimycoticus]
MRKYTIIGDWYSVEDLAPSFTIVTEGETYEEAETNAATTLLEYNPQRAEGENGETPETLWGGDNGAYIIAAFEGDLSDQLVQGTYGLIA